MASWCRDEGRDDANEVIVHVSRVPQGLCASGHDSRDLRIVPLVTYHNVES